MLLYAFHHEKNAKLHTFNVGGKSLNLLENERDLGVMIDTTCTLSRQVSAAALKGNQVLGQRFKNLHEDIYAKCKTDT